MRCFSVVALCLLAAHANAASMDEIKSCVSEELKSRVDQMIDEIDERLEKIADEGNAAARQAGKEFKKKAKEFQDAMTQPLDQASTEYDECVDQSSGFTGRAMCIFNMGKALINKVIPIASEKTVELADAIKGIAVQFRDNRKAEVEDLGEKGREFAKQVLAAITDCVTK